MRWQLGPHQCRQSWPAPGEWRVSRSGQPGLPRYLLWPSAVFVSRFALGAESIPGPSIERTFEYVDTVSPWRSSGVRDGDTRSLAHRCFARRATRCEAAEGRS